MNEREAAVPLQSWEPPPAAHPVRCRIDVLPRVDGTPNTDLAVAMATAGLLTSGTVLIRDWEAPSAAYDEALRHTWADLGAYVVSSQAGLTATSRSTGGQLVGGHWDLSGASIAVAATIAAACTVADGPSTVRGAGRRTDEIAVALRELGVRVTTDGAVLSIEPGRPWPGTWCCDPDLGPAGLALSAIVPLTLDRWDRVEADTPGAGRLWMHALSADEYLMPGSAKLPGDYVR